MDAGEDAVEIKRFPGGRFAMLAIRDPFSIDFPLGWGVLLRWTFDRHVENGLGCASPDDCYSLYLNEETPCLEELYEQEGVQYMSLLLPVRGESED